MIKTFTNPKPWHKYNPIYEYEVYEGKINVEGLADKILELEQTILKDRNVLAEKAWKQLLDKSRTNQFTQFNLLQLDQTKFLKEEIKREAYKYLRNDCVLYGRAWANVLRNGEAFPPHAHCVGLQSYISGNIAVQTNETSTYYLTPFYREIYESKNEDGNIALFPSWLEHYTDQAKPGQERITLGVDLIPFEAYEIGVLEDKKSHWEKL
tara:strand:+ start:56 stop:682 length:627 start_codon:yes stop_codon:yes gene_type:complete